MKESSAFRGRVLMVVLKAPCIVTGGGEDVRQELAPTLSIDRVKGTWKATDTRGDTPDDVVGRKGFVYNFSLW